MTYPPIPTQPPNIPTPPPQRKTVRVAVALLAAAAVATVGIAVGIGVSRDSSPETSSSSPVPKSRPTLTQDPTPTPWFNELDTDDFSIKLRTTERQCFGSAGCSLTVEPELTYLGSTDDVDPDATYEITYEIRGDEDGLVLETLELTNRNEVTYDRTYLSTASSSTEVTVKITYVTSR